MESNTNQKETRVVGRPVIRPDARSKALGRARYAADIRCAGMLHIVTVRAPHSAMADVAVDTSGADILPGVVLTATAKDIPGVNQVPLVFMDQPFLAESRVAFHGEAVALVAAETISAALAAADAVTVNGRELQPCIDPLEAMQPDAPRLYGKDNIFKSYTIQRGDMDREFAESDIIIQREYRTPHQEHAYLETQGVVAEPDDQGGIRITGSMQCPFYVQDAVAAILGIPKSKVTVVQSAVGGAFGGKEDVPSIVGGHAALMAWLTRRPVQLIYRREEDFRAMSKRHPSVTRVKIGADKTGKIRVADIEYILNGGAYATLSPIVLWRGAVHAAGPYTWNAVHIAAHAVATNTVPNGAFRGFGQPQVAFAIESALDELAGKLNMDPEQLRRKNVIQTGDITATGHKITESCGLAEAMEKASAAVNWKEKWIPASRKKSDGNILRGVGCALTFYGVGLGAGGKHLARAGSLVQVENDGSVRVFIGNTEMGQGARSVIGQIAAEALNAPFELIHVGRADTSKVPDSGPTVASRTTVMSGGAVKDACNRILNSLIIAAADILECAPADIRISRNGFTCESTTEKSVKYTEAVKRADALRLPLSAAGWFVSPDTEFGENGQGNAYMTYVWSANYAEVEVDPETFEVTVVKLAAAHDVGRAINPREVQGQIQGGALQGLGYALSETLALDSRGRILNPGFNGYILFTPADVPQIEPIIVEHPFEAGPYGARGIGEPPLIGVAPAVANAVANALNVRVRQLPVNPENIFKAWKNGG